VTTVLGYWGRSPTIQHPSAWLALEDDGRR
jgi:hypothetical protein